MEENPLLTCHFCGTTIHYADVGDTEWCPDFYDKDLVEHGPVCGECYPKYLKYNETDSNHYTQDVVFPITNPPTV